MNTATTSPVTFDALKSDVEFMEFYGREKFGDAYTRAVAKLQNHPLYSAKNEASKNTVFNFFFN